MSCLITEFLWLFSYKLHGILSNSMDTLWHSMKLHRYFREPHGIPWNSTIFLGIPWTSKETPWNFMAFHGTPSLLHGTPWNSMDTPWNSMAFHGTPWILHGTPWHFMELHGYSIELHGVPWNSMEVPWNSMDFHGIPWISIDFHGFPWNSMEFHGGISHGNYIIYFQKIVIFLYKPDEDSSGIDQSKYCKFVV